MRIEQLFTRDIFRPIKGVVVADQLDESSVWQELDEFVVTRELDQHLRRFFTNYCDALDNGTDPEIAQRIGVWVSGFFGSGKSHFIKVLSYLLDNEEHTFEGETKRAVEFFETKIEDAMLFADIKRAVAADTDVILFNIDSKADSHAGREAILTVFLKVFNEMQGFSGDHAHIAHMERYLASEGKLADFHSAYKQLTGDDWVDERDAWEFQRDQVIEALSTTLAQSKESCERWVDGAEDNFTLNIENFAKWVKEYLESKGPDRRIIFLVDEVGQFIGTDTHLMLNLQTITEELGSLCKGKAWIVVTSQEDIDAVLGDIGTSKANDFSKIQGRFKTRLSLSSANVDEVIQERLLAKPDDVSTELAEVFQEKGDVLKHALSFKNIGMTFKQFQDAGDFAKNYPFAPYQFKLLQKIFESIRNIGATGTHLAHGERSLLDAFQSAGKAVAGEDVGVLVPLYRFYPSIEDFLDTTVKRTIDHAQENPALEPFDAQLLEVMFLIRYVDEIKGNVDNLVTLCLEGIDADRLALRHQIEESLQRLEKETLISRSGDNYFFLTNEERDISREIKNVEISSGEEAKLLGELLFDEVLQGHRKHRYTINKMDFPLNRICDGHPFGHRLENGLNVAVVTPLGDNYDSYQESQCILESSQDNGQVVIHLGDEEALGRELRTFLKTDKFLRTKDDGTLPPSTKRVHRDLADENRQRRERLATLLDKLFTEARFYAAGQKLDLKSTGATLSVPEAIEYLIKNTFTKMGYIKVLRENPLKEIQAVLRGDDVEQKMLDLSLPDNNPLAIDEVRKYTELCDKTDKQIVLNDLIMNRYFNRPYGWPEMEVVLLLARLYSASEIEFVRDSKTIPGDKVYEAITTQSQWRKIIVTQRVSLETPVIEKARNIGKAAFSEMGPDGEDPLFEFLQGKLQQWQSSLLQYKALADTGDYPGEEQIGAGLSVTKFLLGVPDSNKFLPRFIEQKDDLLQLSNDFHDLNHFYQHQRYTWDKLRQAYKSFSLNRTQLEANETARGAIARMSEIREAPSPYGMIKETEGLISSVKQINDALVQEARKTATSAIDHQHELVTADLRAADADEALRSRCAEPIAKLRGQVTATESLAHIHQAAQQAVALREQSQRLIAKFLEETGSPGGGDKPKVKPTLVLQPSVLPDKSYLETQDDIEEFLRLLRLKLEEAIANGQRIEIR